jgi:hypothetical protein
MLGRVYLFNPWGRVRLNLFGIPATRWLIVLAQDNDDDDDDDDDSI